MDPIAHRAGAGRAGGTVDADPITTEVIRHGLNSAVTRLALPRGTVLELRTGGGGGFGPSGERDPAAVEQDVREGYVSIEYARRHYPHAPAAVGPRGTRR